MSTRVTPKGQFRDGGSGGSRAPRDLGHASQGRDTRRVLTPTPFPNVESQSTGRNLLSLTKRPVIRSSVVTQFPGHEKPFYQFTLKESLFSIYLS